MTQEALQDALVAEITELFEHSSRSNSLGFERAVNVYPQDLPIREGDDEGENREAPPEPFVIVRLTGGDYADESAPHLVDIIIIVCVYDSNPNRQGYRDTLHIINEIIRRYTTNSIIGRRYVVQYPIKWTTQDEDTHPYYYGGLSFKVEATSLVKEVPYT